MEPRSPEQEQGGLEVVHIGQEFILFAPERTREHLNNHLQVPQFISKITVQLDERYQLPLQIATVPPIGAGSRLNIFFAPFNPELNYSIDARDMNQDEREKKLREYDLRSDPRQAPFNLEIASGSASDLINRGMMDDDTLSFTKDVIAILTRMHVQLSFPIERRLLRYEARPNFTLGNVIYSAFYPTDTGELSTRQGIMNRDNIIVDEGHLIRVPADKQILQQIRGRFVLEPSTTSANNEE